MPALHALSTPGQVSAELLITVAGVFLAFLGVAAFFRTQTGDYLSSLFRILGLPF